MFTVIRRKKCPGFSQEKTVRVGRLFLVDLAGSERLKKSGSLGMLDPLAWTRVFGEVQRQL